MIDCPIGALLDDSICLLWLERHLQPAGFTCPHWGALARRIFRAHGPFPASRGRACEGSYTLLTGTVCAKTRQRPAPLVLLRRGMATGEPTARRARELGRSRQQLQTRRQRVQSPLNATAPTGVMTGPAVEADELAQHAGENKRAPSRSRRPAPAARPSAHGARPLCPRPSPQHQRDLAGAGRAALLGVCSCGQAHLPGADCREPSAPQHVALYGRVAGRSWQPRGPRHRGPQGPRMGPGCRGGWPA